MQGEPNQRDDGTSAAEDNGAGAAAGIETDAAGNPLSEAERAARRTARREERRATRPEARPEAGTEMRAEARKAERRESRKAERRETRKAEKRETRKAERRATRQAERAAEEARLARYPINPLPPLIAVLACAIVGIELLFQLGHYRIVGGASAFGWRINALQDWAFQGSLLEYAYQTGRLGTEAAVRIFTYPFVNESFHPAFFGSVLLLALGTAVSKVYPGWAVVLVLVLSTVTGAVVFTIAEGGDRLLTGDFPAVYGLLGLYTWSLWINAEPGTSERWQAFRLVGLLTTLQLLALAIYGRGSNLLGELSCFVLGFVVAFVVGPGSRERLARWLAAIRG